MPNGWTDAATPVTVALTANAGNDVIVTSDSGFLVDGIDRLAALSGARFELAGPGNLWDVSTRARRVWRQRELGSPGGHQGRQSDRVATPGSEPFPRTASSAMTALQLCQLPNNITVRGTLQGTVNSDGAARTVNVLPLGQYVADVTPSESPASWAALGRRRRAPGARGPGRGGPVLRDEHLREPAGLLRLRRYLRLHGVPGLSRHRQREHPRPTPP